MNQEEQPRVCDVCGKPATNSARDVLEKPDYSTGTMTYQPIGGPKYGCDEHPATSERHQSRGI